MVILADNHRMRLEALHNGLPVVLWMVLVIGGIATIVFTYFFSAHRLQIQLIMVSMVSLVICLNIFLLASYDDPFSGDVRIAPSAFEADIQTFKSEIDANEPKGGN
jgi:ABC-type branched-subunit amino acid transport system permease subunit